MESRRLADSRPAERTVEPYPSAHPSILLLHDGELADVAALLCELGAAITERRGGPAPEDAETELAPGARERAPRARSPDRVCCARAPSASPSSMASRGPCAPCCGARASSWWCGARSIPVALRLLLLHALYRGPEKRRTPRVSVGAPVHFRAGLRRHRAILAEISERGCRLLTSQRVTLGQTLTLQIPAALAGGRAFSVKGLVVRMTPRPDRRSRRADARVRSGARRLARCALRAVVSAHRAGTLGADARRRCRRPPRAAVAPHRRPTPTPRRARRSPSRRARREPRRQPQRGRAGVGSARDPRFGSRTGVRSRISSPSPSGPLCRDAWCLCATRPRASFSPAASPATACARIRARAWPAARELNLALHLEIGGPPLRVRVHVEPRRGETPAPGFASRISRPPMASASTACSRVSGCFAAGDGPEHALVVCEILDPPHG